MSIEQLENEGWICTDPSCNQYRKDLDGDNGDVYLFREDRTINPETGETKEYQTEIDLKNYGWLEKVEACEPFGYNTEQVDEWINRGEEKALIAECIFEMDMDAWIE